MPTMTDPSLKNTDLLTLSTLDAAQIEELFITAAATKRDVAPFRRALDGKTIILLFEKPSLRTRVTFEVGPGKMGAKTIFFDHSKERVGARESVRDYGKNLERWVDAIVARVFSQEVLEELAENCRVPVINALSDSFHPCQALADYFTLAEKLGVKGGVKSGLARLKGFKLAYVGDGNNVCASLMHGASKLGVHMTVICPKGYQPEPVVLEEARAMAGGSGGTITISHDANSVKGAQAVYTDTWVSMGDEAEKVKRMGAFAKFRVDEKLMETAGNGSGEPFFMHCLPAHRGAEVTDGVIDGPTSIVYDQAENRMHVQNALLLHMLGGV
jgi:ornithine carbamoyltransferase